MADWSEWRQFPNPKDEGYLEAPFGPGVYELRHRSNGVRILFGEGRTVAYRMTSLLPTSHGWKLLRAQELQQAGVRRKQPSGRRIPHARLRDKG